VIEQFKENKGIKIQEFQNKSFWQTLFDEEKYEVIEKEIVIE
jgi:hypothetical protein